MVPALGQKRGQRTQACPMAIQIRDRSLGDTAVHGGFGDRHGQLRQQAWIEWMRDQVVRAEDRIEVFYDRTQGQRRFSGFIPEAFERAST